MFTLFVSMGWPSLSHDTTGFGFPWCMGNVTFQCLQTCYFICGICRWCVCVCVYVLAYKKRDDKVDLCSNLLDKAGPESTGHSDLGTVWKNNKRGQGTLPSAMWILCVCNRYFTSKYITWQKNLKLLAAIFHHMQRAHETGRTSRSATTGKVDKRPWLQELK